MGQTSVGRLHGRLDVLQTSFPPSPSWIQDGGAGNDVIQDLGRVFRSPLRSEEENGGPSASGGHLGWPHLWEPEMRSSKMAAGSGRAAIFLLTPQWGSKNAPYTTYIYIYIGIYIYIYIYISIIIGNPKKPTIGQISNQLPWSMLTTME